MMARFHALHVVASFVLFLAFVACGISFFSPYWLGNVTSPWPGNAERWSTELSLSYLFPESSEKRENYGWRGLWAQCAGDCQWFWENGYSLQNNKFNALPWHLAVQILYFIGAFLVLFSELYARVILCCDPRLSVYRSIGFILLISFVIQAAAVSVFGGFANRDYGAVPYVDSSHTYFAWSFWMSVAGGGLTLISAVLFLLFDCAVYDIDDDLK